MLGEHAEKHGMVSNGNNFELADICISYLAFQGFENDTSAMNSMEDP